MSRLIVGERWNAPELVGRWDGKWCVSLSMRLGAFRAGYSGNRLRELGFSWEYSANLLPPGEQWNHELAKRIASAMLMAPMWSIGILCGRRVAEAFGIHDPQWFERYPIDGKQLFAIPHPSGRSRIWNNPDSRAMARKIATQMQELNSSA